MPSYMLDLSSAEGLGTSDLIAGQALIVVDPITNTASIIVKDSAGDAFTIPLAPALMVVATGAEIDTGTDNVKYVTPKAMEDSTYAKVVAPTAFIADPAGGGTNDAEARTAIGAILDLLIARGYMAAS